SDRAQSARARARLDANAAFGGRKCRPSHGRVARRARGSTPGLGGIVKILAFVTIASLAVAPAFAQDEHAGHAMQAVQSAAPAPRNPALPPDNDAAKEQLATSPRHGEWVDVKMAGGPAINSFVIYPERSSKAPVVIVVHDIGGMSEWIRGIGDQLAKEGFIA